MGPTDGQRAQPTRLPPAVTPNRLAGTSIGLDGHGRVRFALAATPGGPPPAFGEVPIWDMLGPQLGPTIMQLVGAARLAEEAVTLELPATVTDHWWSATAEWTAPDAVLLRFGSGPLGAGTATLAGYVERVSALMQESAGTPTPWDRIAQLAIPTLADSCALRLWRSIDTEPSFVRAPSNVRLLPSLRSALHRYLPDNPDSAEARLLHACPGPLLFSGGQSPAHPSGRGRHRNGAGSPTLIIAPIRLQTRTIGGLLLFRAGVDQPADAPMRLAAVNLLAACGAQAAGHSRLVETTRAALQERDEFFLTAVHDLVGPLTNVRGFTQLLRREAEQNANLPTAQIQARLTQIERGATQLADQVEELRDLARMQMGQPLDLRRASTDLVALTQEVIAEQRGLADQEIRLIVDQPRLVGNWDAHRLHRVLTNLLTNAIKYSPAGGDVQIRLTAIQDGEERWTVIEVRDQGLGIPAVDVPLLFRQGHRGQNVPETLPGTGLGLVSVRRIVEQHGGTVAVESHEGSGATFTIRLPDGEG
ncbi:MAG TPA: HAMP domain-containing sensor histidine kinase [Chloroflexota bacterium]|nr:HAMP domain-containing sensor histidine kinase [Chloroflexota bacterium]